MEMLVWLKGNYENVLMVLAALYVPAELVVRLTPTKKDDSLLEKIGYGLKKVMDFMKIPNNLK